MKNEKNREWFLLVITTILCVVPILFVLPFYEQLPAQIGVHWDSHGNINNYVSKPMAVFGIPVLMAVFNLGVNFVSEADPRRKNTSKKIRFLLKLFLPAICFIFYPITILIALGKEIRVEKVVPVLIGILFIFIGNYLPKCKQNYTIGIKIPWTLHSEENWNKTHHMAGYLWMVGGILFLVTGLFSVPEWVPLVYLVIVMLLIPFCYSYCLFKKGI